MQCFVKFNYLVCSPTMHGAIIVSRASDCLLEPAQSDRLSPSLAGTLIPASFHLKPKWISLTAIADLFLREVVVGQWFWTLCDSDVSLFLLLQYIFDATTPFWMSSWTSSPYSFWPLFNEASVVPVLLKQWFSILWFTFLEVPKDFRPLKAKTVYNLELVTDHPDYNYYAHPQPHYSAPSYE